jgi:predicted RNA methylase
MNNENRVFQAYYTESTPIVNYMVDLLNLNGNETIFEPCAGDGIFIQAILENHEDIKIDAFEFNEDAFKILKNKFIHKENINIEHTDTLTNTELEFFCSMGGKYEAIIANPPYGAWRNIEERKELKKRFNGFSSKESYSLFLYRCIEALKNKGKLVFIIPDTYLSINRHTQLRKYILTKTKIKEIALFPSSYFPNVNFGYANLSIIALEKCDNQTECLNTNFTIINGYQAVEELGKNNLIHLNKLEKSQNDIINTDSHTFFTSDNQLTDCIKKTELTIGMICNCVTGFYSGNDKEYLKVKNKEIRNSKKYEIVNENEITYTINSENREGIKDNKIYIPIVKGGNTKYFKPNNWFMSWSADLVKFYKTDKKARFQNPTYYFKQGIAIPMVSSSSITASLIENRLFDQSIVGVFPKDEKWIYYLLAFFNSPTCNKLIRTLNSSTNNSANYIKKIPFITPTSQQLETITKNTQNIFEEIKTCASYSLQLEEENNNLIKKIYGF